MSKEDKATLAKAKKDAKQGKSDPSTPAAGPVENTNPNSHSAVNFLLSSAREMHHISTLRLCRYLWIGILPLNVNAADENVRDDALEYDPDGLKVVHQCIDAEATMSKTCVLVGEDRDGYRQWVTFSLGKSSEDIVTIGNDQLDYTEALVVIADMAKECRLKKNTSVFRLGIVPQEEEEEPELVFW